MLREVLHDALAAAAADAFVESTSRRLCNLAYVLWVGAQVGLVLILAMLRDAAAATAPPPLLEAVNRRPLSVFLLANVLTGAVNLTCDTMAASHALAAGVLGAYMAIVCGAAVALDRWT